MRCLLEANMATGLPSMVLFSSYKGNPNQRKSQESQKTSTRAPIYLWLHSPFLSTIVLKTNPAISLEDWRFSGKKKGWMESCFSTDPWQKCGGKPTPQTFRAKPTPGPTGWGPRQEAASCWHTRRTRRGICTKRHWAPGSEAKSPGSQNGMRGRFFFRSAIGKPAETILHS